VVLGFDVMCGVGSPNPTPYSIRTQYNYLIIFEITLGVRGEDPTPQTNIKIHSS